MKRTCTLLLAVALTVSAHGQITLISDDFSTNGNLVGTTPDSGVGVWTQISATGSQLSVLDGSVNLIAGSNQSAQLNFSSSNVSNGTIYAGFNVLVPASTISGTGDTISTFFGFRSGTASSGSFELGFGLFRPNGTAQTAGAPSTTTSQFVFGIGDGTSLSNGGTRWGAISDVNSSYRIVLGWNFDTDTASLWVNPTSISSTSVSASGLDGVARAIYLRQGAGTHGAPQISNLQVSNDFLVASAIPEPSAFAAVLGVMVFVGTVTRRGSRGWQ